MKNKDNQIERVKIIPLGGLEQIGMNITAIEYGDSIVVIDCGMSFPEDDMLGVDFVLPDTFYLEENYSKVKGFVITHGHEDHIGAIPYVFRKINVPIYTTKLTMALIENKLEEHEMLDVIRRNVVNFGDVVTLGDIKVEFIKTNHSIQDAAALALYTPAGVLFHTGDFKVDYTPVFGDSIDLQRFAEIGRQGVLALMCDSTNAEHPGFTMSERTVGVKFDQIFTEHAKSRLIIATFASNIDRVQQIINSAAKFGRKVVLEGRSMVKVIGTAITLGYVDDPAGTVISVDDMKNYPPEKLVLVTTGSQGESMAALSRMAANIHKKVTLIPGDVIVFSSHPIPGNEKAVSNVINELSEIGVHVIFEDTHVSGHACQEEIKLIYSLLRPKYAIPVHGEMRHLRAHAGTILVDGLGVGDVGNIVIRDRQKLSEDGIVIIVLTLEKYTNRLLSGPDIVSRGFVYVRESEGLLAEAKQTVDEAVFTCLDHNVTDWGKIKSDIKDSLSDFIWRRTQRRPMILPIIMEADT